MPVFTNDVSNENFLQGVTLLKVALNNPEIIDSLAKFNNPPEKLQNYLARYEELDILFKKQRTEYSEQHEAARVFENATKTANEKYMFNFKLARVIFKKNEKAQEDLLINGRRKKSFSGWFTDADIFYNALLSNKEYLVEFSPYNISYDDLAEEHKLLKELVNLNAIFLKEKSEALEATRQRDELLDELDESLNDLIKICKLRFAKRPEILKQLGILA